MSRVRGARNLILSVKLEKLARNAVVDVELL